MWQLHNKFCICIKKNILYVMLYIMFTNCKDGTNREELNLFLKFEYCTIYEQES